MYGSARPGTGQRRDAAGRFLSGRGRPGRPVTRAAGRPTHADEDHMTDLQIPPHLLTYDEQHWMPHVEDSIRHRGLRARELWRMAQDRWGHEHGIWRAEFEQMQQAQRAAREDSNGE